MIWAHWGDRTPPNASNVNWSFGTGTYPDETFNVTGSFGTGTYTRNASNIRLGDFDIDILVCFAGEWLTLGAVVEAQYVGSFLTVSNWLNTTGSLESASLPIPPLQWKTQPISMAVPRAKDIVTRLSTAAEIGEDDAIELVYDQLHQQIMAGGLDVINEFIRILNVKKHQNSVLLSILTVTAMSDVRIKLIERDAFYGRVRELLIQREGPEGAEELLFGLE